MRLTNSHDFVPSLIRNRLRILVSFFGIILSALDSTWGAPDLSYLSFFNAVASDEPVSLIVDGRSIGRPYPFGSFTGAMGFKSRKVGIRIKHADMSLDKLVVLSRDYPTLLIAYTKATRAPDGKMISKLAALSIRPRDPAARPAVRMISLVDSDQLDLELDFVNGRNRRSKSPRMAISLRPFEVCEVQARPPFRCLSKENVVGVHDVESADCWLLAFFRDEAGELQMAALFDE